jgi:hypothetical protein
MRQPPDKRNGPHASTGRRQPPQTTTDSVAAEQAAWRCFTWRTSHGCGCGKAADCLLNEPLPVHADAWPVHAAARA